MSDPNRRQALHTLAAGAALAGCPALAQDGPPGRRPNLLLVMTDQQCADALSCRMGDRWLHTPAMDSLAARGWLATRAYAANPLCMPQRAAMFSGYHTHQTRVMTNDQPPGGFDVDAFPCLGTTFRQAGYHTAYSGKWHLCYNVKDPTTHGFDILTSPVQDNHDAKVADAAVRFLNQAPQQPFLLVVSFLNPHNICEWARRLAGRQQTLNCGEIGDPPADDQLPPPPDNLDPPRDEPDSMTLIRRGMQASHLFPVAGFTPADWRRQRWGYYRMIEKVDGELQKVLTALRQAELEDDTVVIFTSDHGECAGAHRFNQKTVLYEESVRVPLIVAAPGRTPVATSDRLINTGIDLLPTLLDCAGLAASPELPGRSLWPLATGQPPETWRDHVVVENHIVQTGPVDGFTPTLEGRMVRTERYKYCLYSHGQRRESLVDLQADPGETVDLAADPGHRDVLLAHRALLARFAIEQNDPRAAAMLAEDVKPRPFVATPAPENPA